MIYKETLSIKYIFYDIISIVYQGLTEKIRISLKPITRVLHVLQYAIY